jgi:hypothetical protein
MMRTIMAEGTVGGNLLRRAILLLAAAVILASMMSATASPAFALRQRDSGLNFLCIDGPSGETILVNGRERNNLEDQGFTYVKVHKRRI